MFKMRTKIDLRGVDEKIRRSTEKAQATLDQQVLNDSNKFAPMDVGTLIGSSLTASEIGKGRLVWDTPYARRLYWNPQYNFSRDSNANAGGLWFARAKAMYLSDWVKLAQRGFK